MTATLTTPNATYTDAPAYLARVIARLEARGARIENVSNGADATTDRDGWFRTAPNGRWAGQVQRRWMIDASLDGPTVAGCPTEVWGCVVVVETRGGGCEIGLYSPESDTDPAHGGTAAFRRAIGWRG